MAAKLNKRQADNTRACIKTRLLVNKLQNHTLNSGKKAVALTQTQVRAAEILLRKSLPDMQSIEFAGEVHNTHAVSHDALLAKLLRSKT